MKTPFRTIYTHDRAVSALFATHNTEDDMTSQADVAECDINVIMSRYSKTGQLPQVIEPGEYGDFSAITDYRDAVDLVRRSEELFHQVPAEIRKNFDNDPAKFLDFAQNPNNAEKMVEYGLANHKKDDKISTTPPKSVEVIQSDKESKNGKAASAGNDGRSVDAAT